MNLFCSMIAALTMTVVPTPEGFDAGRLAAAGERLQRFVDDGELSGVVVLVRRHDQVVLSRAIGLADRSPARPMTTNTIFQVMSMTKPVTAMAVMLCVERGLLNLDDPVERYLPALSDLMVVQSDGTLVKKKSRLTVRHLLTHTGGFPSIDPGGLSDEAKIKLTLQEYAALMPKLSLIAEPGMRISYSGPGIALAGRIVEIVSGMRLPDFMQKEIFQPLQMDRTSFFAPAKSSGSVARLYYVEDGALKLMNEDPYRPGARYANPAGGLYSTASDMATFIECFVNRGVLRGRRILSPRACDAMTTLQTGDLLSDGSDAQGYGLGFSVVRSIRGGAHLKPVGSFGHTGAYGTEFWADPTSKMVVVFMAQTFSDRARKTFNTMVNAAYIGD